MTEVLQKSLQKSLRIPVLAVLLTGALLTLVRAIVTPTAPSSTAALALPDVPLEGWQLTAVSPLKPADDGLKGQLYQYRPSASSTPDLQVELRQVQGDGNNSRFLFVYSAVKQGNNKLQERQRSETGFYGVLSHEGRAYLTACINPEGGSTVTEQQFVQNRSQNVWQVGRVVTWLMGQGSLSDKRCLWTLMSLPIERTQSEAVASEAAYQTLETAWVSWYRWWQPNFPPSPYK